MIVAITGGNEIVAQTVRLLDEGVSLQLAQHRKETISDLRYDISFALPESKDDVVEGREAISFYLDKGDSVIIDFRESKEKIHSVTANDKACAWYFVNEHIVIPREAMRKGVNSVSIEFEAGNQSLNRRDGYVYTLFVPDRARTVFPCFEQPNLKGRFTLTLEVPERWKAVSNTYQESETFANGRKTLRFAETEPLSTYLFAFAAGDFQYQQFTKGSRTIGAYYRETDSKRLAQLPDIFTQVMFALEWQDQFTGVAYPFAKYDIVILPGFQFGGMEHTGATFYNDNTLFLPENPTPDEELRRTELISHETSHMWFGDAVTMDWFNDVWTKEVFANYFAAEITEPLFPELDHKLNWLRTYQGAAISQDRTEGRTSIRQHLENMRYAGLIYNNIIYNKAPVMMRKMVAMMGKEAFRRGIQKYVRTYMYGNATWDDLVAILDAETPADLKAFSKQWVDTPNWPQRKAKTYCDAYDMDYYGYTELTEQQVDSATDFNHIANVSKAEMMALVMNLNENYLAKNMDVRIFMGVMAFMSQFPDPLLASAAIKNLSEPLRELQQTASAQEMEQYEQILYSIAYSTATKAGTTQMLRLLIANATSPSVTDSLYGIWKQGTSPYLSINDFMTLAYELAVRMPEHADSILRVQRSRITNPDRLRQFDFVSRAVNASQQQRDSLFMSLHEPENRRIEPWTLSVLYYLNHPLRQKESVKYIRPALEWLTDIQRTGDIFFPGNWCSSLLAGHRSTEAYHEVETFLSAHQDMLPLLRNKILSAEYYLKRADGFSK